MSVYTSEVKKQILDFAGCVEGSLAKTGVLLTMGGEPTFVPINPIGLEWQTAALGPTKLAYARKLATEWIKTVCPGGVVLETSGKHYPGEPLPRWALLIQKRIDGINLWQNTDLLKTDAEAGIATLADAEELIKTLAQLLAIEDTTYLSFCEGEALEKTTGYVLPLDHDGIKWITQDWSKTLHQANLFKGKSISLLVGDGPAGLRLPLFALKEHQLKRAITIEVNEGTLVLGIPPLLYSSYCQLLAVIESSLQVLQLGPVVLTGYPPPSDSPLITLGLASDPGVLEVNISPCKTWHQYEEQLKKLYAAADACGLSARKLQFNGRVVGTGGGAHIVFGGPEDMLSPFFAFRSFLPSIIRYWQHHPALSYAFTGAYMGPSSQAPRIDESTFEALYELEIACNGCDHAASAQNLGLYDLLFRDLLMDRSGNTHRAEISVDKLWNPWAPNGRLGLVEFRAFETHPDYMVQSVTALLLRAILARLVSDPFKKSFIRFGGELHDRYFLPSFVWEDLCDICEELKQHHLPFSPEWLRPHWNFRFPELGVLMFKDQKLGDSSITFRQALEAWPLLGESPNAGTLSRTVDSSVDRIEARISDTLLLKRGVLLVNGFPCAFRDLKDFGAACGIRYKAFNLMPSLQPHVPVHSPLLLEWVDLKTSTVLAAARWHVWNPNNESYSSAPDNEASAALRRKERWEEWTQTVGQHREIKSVTFPPEGKYTLDLRRYLF